MELNVQKKYASSVNALFDEISKKLDVPRPRIYILCLGNEWSGLYVNDELQIVHINPFDRNDSENEPDFLREWNERYDTDIELDAVEADLSNVCVCVLNERFGYTVYEEYAWRNYEAEEEEQD